MDKIIQRNKDCDNSYSQQDARVLKVVEIIKKKKKTEDNRKIGFDQLNYFVHNKPPLINSIILIIRPKHNRVKVMYRY